MSSFAVSNQNIHVCVSAMLPHTVTQAPPEDSDELGRKMLRLNAEALRQRYGEGEEMAKGAEARAKTYKYTEPLATKEAQFKALECWLYQCSEGSVPKRKLFREVDAARYALACSIVRESKEYDKARWE